MLYITSVNTIPTFKAVFAADIFIQKSVHIF
ncbi:Uncharacterised protein [Paraprevotella clara]|uniref:Uncharacterized protein n=1 Tax=Paraprevotella clara TaxID=454154 RepID=A0A6N3BCC4_9BACT